EGATIENVQIKNSVINGVGNNVGMLSGKSSTVTIRKTIAEGDVEGVDFVGGLIGQTYRNTISDVYTAGNVSGQSQIGGVVGGADFDSNTGTTSDTYTVTAV